MHEVLKRLIPVRDGEALFEEVVDAWLVRFCDSSFAPPLLKALMEVRFARWAPWAMRYLDANEGAPGSETVMSSAITRICLAEDQTLNEIQVGLSRNEAVIFQRLRRRARRA